MATRTKTKRKSKRYVPAFVLTDGKTNFTYTLDVTPMTKKKVEAFDKLLQDSISSGKLKTSLAYVEA